MKTALLLGLVVLVGLAALAYTTGFGIFGAVTASTTAEETAGKGGISIPLSEITTTARFYDFTSGSTTIRYFAVKAGDGSIKTAFDACDVCYKNKKGYRQEGNFMVCNNCGRRFSIDGLGTENKGSGCWPGYLPSRIEGNALVIRQSDIEAGTWRFL